MKSEQAGKPLPRPGRKKRDPEEMEKLIDEGSRESMITSDPPAVAQPDVHNEPGREPSPACDKPEEKKH